MCVCVCACGCVCQRVCVGVPVPGTHSAMHQPQGLIQDYLKGGGGVSRGVPGGGGEGGFPPPTYTGRPKLKS